VDFCNALSNDLQTLHLTEFRKFVNLAFLRCIPQLKTFILDKCDFGVFDDFVRQLEPASSPQDSASTLPASLLPNLQTLGIENISIVGVGHYDKGESTDRLAQSLEKRMKKMNMDREFKLELVPAGTWWSRGSKTMLRELIMNDGVPLKIFDGEEEMFCD
jgi:hypothetical protein